LGKNSAALDLLKGRKTEAPSQRELAFQDVRGSSILRSMADRQPGFQARKVGRPRGAKNRDSAKLLALISERMGTDPLLWMADIVRLTLPEAAQLLECKPLEAASFQLRCAQTLNEYARGKPTQRHEVTDAEGAGLPIFAPMFFATQQEAEQAATFGFGDDVEFEGDFEDITHKVTMPQVTEGDSDGAND
jgi:hypothetical protein